MTVPRQELEMRNYDTCDRCKHCTERAFNEDTGEIWYFCEIDNDYIAETWAMNPNIGCDTFEQKLDDHETEESKA